MRRVLNDRERVDWVQLIRTQGIGPITFYRLLTRFGSAADALVALPGLGGRAKPLKPYSRALAEEEIKKAWDTGTQILASCEPDYPILLTKIADPPPVLSVRGHVSLFEKPGVAIIGARNASALGCKLARSLAADLGAAGYSVISGLARGIDGAAHMAGLAHGTIAVVAGGVDVIYPPEHDTLTRDITREGLILSERPLGAEPTARDFPRRNRLISGLSRGVIIVEAAARSGTLITARYALEQGREVFAVPGSPLDPRCKGANALLRDGATLVESADDVISVLRAQLNTMQEPDTALTGDLFDALNATDQLAPPADEAGAEQDRLALCETVRALLGVTPIHRDELIRECHASSAQIADALLDLVLSGTVTEISGGHFALADPG
ncbi:MAG: DNA-processing protein DprA [Pseudomonadota bacterium]